MYDTPQQVANAVKEEFDVVVDRRVVRFYDPTTVNVEKPGKKWVDIFTATRERFLDASSEIPISQKSVRLRRLDDLFGQMQRNRNAVFAAQLLKQAAEEVGGVYTNRRELTGKNGEPLVPDLTADERRERVVSLLTEAKRRSELSKQDAVAAATPVKTPAKPLPKKKVKR